MSLRTGSLKEWYFEAKIQVDDFSSVPKGNVDLKFDLHPLMLVLVSLGSHKSLSKLDLRVSKTWFRHALAQVQTVLSKHITEVLFYYWLDREEEPFNAFWKGLDIILSTDTFEPLTRVNVGSVYREGDQSWHYTEHFDKREFPTLLPMVFKKGILAY